MDVPFSGVFCSFKCARRAFTSDVSQDGYDIIPDVFLHPSVDRLLKLNGVALRHALNWVTDPFDKKADKSMHDDTHWLLLHGSRSGTGKTRIGTEAFMALCLQNGREWEPSNIQWLPVGKLLQRYRDVIRDNEGKAELQRTLTNCEFLFLDDIDKIKPTEGLQELLFAALDERSGYQNRKTIFTTNLSGNQLEEKWGPEYGPYLVRRLKDFCYPINCDDTEGLDPNTEPNTPHQTQYEIERLNRKNTLHH